jgi:membrane-associated phospholipid phosphatase
MATINPRTGSPNRLQYSSSGWLNQTFLPWRWQASAQYGRSTIGALRPRPRDLGEPLEGKRERVRKFTLSFLPRIAACLLIICVTVCRVSYASEVSSSDTSVMSPIIDAPGDALPDAPAPQTTVTEKGLPLAILKDQLPLWASPVRIRTHDLIWLLPLGAATGVTLATDTGAMRGVSHDRSFNKDSVNVSNSLLGGQIAVPVVLYGVGLFKGNAHARETGILSGEALADSVVVEEVTKIIFRRERPLYNDAAGHFFASNVGPDGSFPSSHSMLAWTLAAVVAGEYPSKWVQLGVYSVASGVSVTRVLGQEHFPTDVLLGGVAGWLIGHYVFEKYRVHNTTHAPKAKIDIAR